MVQKLKTDYLNLNGLIKTAIVLAGLVGGGVSIGDRLYARKAIEIKVENMSKQVDFMHKAFMDAAKFAKVEVE